MTGQAAERGLRVLTTTTSSPKKELTYHLVYQLQAGRDDLVEAYEYLVDAHDGSILRKVSLIEHVNGDGRVYQTTPNHSGTGMKTLYRLDAGHFSQTRRMVLLK